MSFALQVDWTRRVIVSARANAGAPTDADAMVAPAACCRNRRRGAARASVPAAEVLECRKFIAQLLGAASCWQLRRALLRSKCDAGRRCRSLATRLARTSLAPVKKNRRRR